MHRDIKPENILLNMDRVAITDFGISTRPRKDARMTTSVVTVTYRAPELWLDDPHYNYTIDVWSAGVIFYQLVKLRMPWKIHSPAYDALLAMFTALGSPIVLPGWYDKFPGLPIPDIDRPEPFLPSRLPAASLDFIESMLDYDKMERSSAESAVEHEFFYESFD
jgi:serine/threonine protein kinase